MERLVIYYGIKFFNIVSVYLVFYVDYYFVFYGDWGWGCVYRNF